MSPGVSVTSKLSLQRTLYVLCRPTSHGPAPGQSLSSSFWGLENKTIRTFLASVIEGKSLSLHAESPSWSAQADITKYNTLGALNNRHLFLTLWRLECQGASVVRSWWGPVSWLADTTFSLCPHNLSGVSSYKGTNTIMGTPPSAPHLNLITSQRPHLLTPSHWGLRVQYMNFSGMQISSL